MRLLHTNHLHFDEFFEDACPDYAILSHTWCEQNQELTYRDFLDGRKRDTKGYAKIVAVCQIARSLHLDWVWFDTCCLDKSSSAELTEAINSMFRWYQSARVCLVYLEDVAWVEYPERLLSTVSSTNNPFEPSEARRLQGSPASRHGFRQARWHTRGWILQELLAPSHMKFYDREWHFIGEKEDLCIDIEAATGIESKYLEGMPLREASVATKMRWAAGRRCSRVEDISYSLLGIFDISMPIIYGEGANAFMRLQEEIFKRTNDKSIFAWTTWDGQTGKEIRGAPPPAGASWQEIAGAFAPSPDAFKHYREAFEAGTDNDDVASILSFDSLGSTATGSSATLIGEALAAAEEFVDILRRDERLSPIFNAAMDHVTAEELKSKLRELLKVYSIDLQQEVSNSLEKDAVQLVRRRRAFIAYKVCQYYDVSAAKLESQFVQIIEQDPDKHALLEEYARTRVSADMEAEPVRELENDGDGGSDPSSESELENLEPTDLDRVKAFMVQSTAYERLIQNLKGFILPFGEPEQTIGKSPDSRYTTSVDLWRRVGMKGLEAIQSLKMLCRPVIPAGYERISWICGCGEHRYADVREYSPYGAARLQATLRQSANLAAVSAADADPARPPQAHLPVGSSPEPSFDNMSQFIYARAAGEPTGRVSLNSVFANMSSLIDDDEDHVYLLLCITVNGVSTLEQLNVRGLDNDSYLFNNILASYRRLHVISAWHQKISLTRRIVSRSSWLSRVFNAIDLTVPHSISFVRFHLAPVRMDIRPWNFESPELPPENEVKNKKNYHYHPCPAGVNLKDLDREIIHSLLKPDQPHLDRFWLDLFPKKLKEELLYQSGSPDMCTGWGIRIVEGINGFVVMLLMIALVIMSGILGIVYSILTHDVGGGFGMATFVGMLPALGLAALQLMPASR